MPELVVAEKLRGRHRQRRLELLGYEVMGHLEGLELESVDLDLVRGGWVKVTLLGGDEIAAANLVRALYGEVRSIREASVGQELRGFARDVERVHYGLYLDAFLEEKDALLPLHSLRRSLVGRKVSLSAIVRCFGIAEGEPIYFQVSRVGGGEVEASLGTAQVERFRGWYRRGLDVLIVCGATDRELRGALRRSGHEGDVLRVDRLSFLSHCLTCKGRTDAVGLVPELGPLMPSAEFGVFSPKRLKESLRVRMD